MCDISTVTQQYILFPAKVQYMLPLVTRAWRGFERLILHCIKSNPYLHVCVIYVCIEVCVCMGACVYLFKLYCHPHLQDSWRLCQSSAASYTEHRTGGGLVCLHSFLWTCTFMCLCVLNRRVGVNSEVNSLMRALCSGGVRVVWYL